MVENPVNFILVENEDKPIFDTEVLGNFLEKASNFIPKAI